MKNKIKSVIAIALVLLLTSVFVISVSADGYDDGTVHFESADILGDVNDDLILDVRDLARLKEVIDKANVEYNELNAELDGKSTAITDGDLVSLKKLILET